MTSCTGSMRRRFWGIWEKSLSWVLPRRKKVDFRSLTRWGLVSGAHVVWGRWKSQVYLSPYVKKPLNSKVIKSFVPELKSHKCFSCFGIPMFYVYVLWTFYVRFTYLYHGYVTLVGPLDCIQCPHRANVCIYWLASTVVSICRSPWENVAYEFIFTSSAVSCMSCSSYLDSSWDGRLKTIEFLYYGMLFLGFLWNSK